MMHPERERWIEDGRNIRRLQDEIGRRGIRLKKIAVNEYAGPCPKCGGTDRFSINTQDQVFNCRGCRQGGKGVIDLTMFLDGADLDGAVETLTGKPPPKPNGHSARPVEAGRWLYKDADGNRYLLVRRLDRQDGRKDYPQYHWDGKQWVKGKPASPKIPYRLPELLDSDRSEPVYICEGEKCADAVAGLGLAATSASEGAGKWTPDLNEWFRDRIAYILPDNDGPGRNHAKLVAHNLAGIARQVRIVELPGLGDREDAFDWIARGGTRDQLDELGDAAPVYGADPLAGIIQGPDGLQETIEPDLDYKLLQTVADFLAAFSSPEYVVDGLLKRGFLYALTAMTGGGKTAIALLIAEIASNRKRRRKLGPHEVEHVRVVYIACENSEDVRMRLIGMEARMGFERADLDMLVIDKVFDLAKNMERIFKEAKDFGGNIGLVFIDTSAAMFQGADENDNPQMLAHAKLQRKLCDLPGRPCVIALCHPPKHVDRPELLLPRGGGAYLNEVDGNFTAWAHDERMTRLYWTSKLRGPDFEPIEFRLPTIYTTNLVDAKGRAIPTVMAEVIGEAEISEVEQKSQFQDNRLLQAILKSPEGSIASWARDCGWLYSAKPGEQQQPNKSLVQRVLKRLTEYRYVKKKGRGYGLTSEGEKAAEKAPKPVSAG